MVNQTDVSTFVAALQVYVASKQTPEDATALTVALAAMLSASTAEPPPVVVPPDVPPDVPPVVPPTYDAVHAFLLALPIPDTMQSLKDAVAADVGLNRCGSCGAYGAGNCPNCGKPVPVPVSVSYAPPYPTSFRR